MITRVQLMLTINNGVTSYIRLVLKLFLSNGIQRVYIVVFLITAVNMHTIDANIKFYALINGQFKV